MVCIPCIVIPFFLFIWHRFLQPYVLKYFTPWKKVDQTSNTSQCPMKSVIKEDKEQIEELKPVEKISDQEITASDKKTD